jgi:hypothetical protein
MSEKQFETFFSLTALAELCDALASSFRLSLSKPSLTYTLNKLCGQVLE